MVWSNQKNSPEFSDVQHGEDVHRQMGNLSSDSTSAAPSRQSAVSNPPSSRRSDVSLKRQASQDAFTWMSAERISERNVLKEDAPSTHVSEVTTLPPSYPLPLVFFVCILSVMGGFIVSGVHYMILFSGCPLGLNGCNDFSPEKEKYGFFLVRALRDTVPEDIVYISSAVIGGFIFAQMCTRLPDHLTFQITGGGTLQGLVAVASGQRISLTAASLRLVASCVYLGSGGTLGMDGPAIQVCIAFTTFCGWALGMRGVQTQSLLASLGFAAGFAASFNAPLAGIMFAMEELSHATTNLSHHMICIILMVSTVATGVARLFFGNNELLEAKWSADLMKDVGGGSFDSVFGPHMWMLVSIPIAVVSSIFGHLTSLVMRKLRYYVIRFQPKVPFTALVVLAMALSASIGSGVFRATGLRGVWGIGYESLQKGFSQEHSAANYFIFAAGKALATTVVLSVRAPGDLLEPVIIIGAFIGGGMGRLLQAVVEDELEERVLQPCLVFGMVAFFASCFRFPLTPVLIVLEITGVDAYALVLPAALASFTAVTMSNRLYLPFLETIMEEDGISLHDLLEERELADSEGGDEPEPEEESDSEHSIGGASVASHSSNASKLLTMFRNVETSMLSLSASKTTSRTNSRASSRNGSHSSKQSHDAKLNAMLARLRTGEPSSSRAPSKGSQTPSSGGRSIGCISLNVPISECGEKKGHRSNTQATERSICTSSNYPSESMALNGIDRESDGPQLHDPQWGLLCPGMFGIMPASSASSKVISQGRLPQAHVALEPMLAAVSEFRQERPLPVVRAELEAMRRGALIRSAIMMGFDADVLDDAIETSNEAIIDLIMKKISDIGEDVGVMETRSSQDASSRKQQTHLKGSAEKIASSDQQAKGCATPNVKDNQNSQEARAGEQQIHWKDSDRGRVCASSGAVAILVLFSHKGHKFTFVVRQPQVPLCLGSVAELPVGSIDVDGNFAGVAADVLREGARLELKESDLIDMTNLAYQDRCAGMYLRTEGRGDVVRILLYQRTISTDELEKLNGKLEDVAKAGALTKLQMVPLSSLWKVCADAKALAALTLFHKLTGVGLISHDGIQQVDKLEAARKR